MHDSLVIAYGRVQPPLTETDVTWRLASSRQPRTPHSRHGQSVATRIPVLLSHRPLCCPSFLCFPAALQVPLVSPQALLLTSCGPGRRRQAHINTCRVRHLPSRLLFGTISLPETGLTVYGLMGTSLVRSFRCPFILDLRVLPFQLFSLCSPHV